MGKECGFKLVAGKYCDLIYKLAEVTGQDVKPCDAICQGCHWWKNWKELER